MASNPPGQCCTTGFRHEGTPTGKIVKVAGKWDAYLATPPADKAHKDVAIIFIPDVFGIWQNSQLLADQFALEGYACMIVDILNGDALTLDQMEKIDIMKWIDEGSDGKNPHNSAAIDPIVEAAAKCLKEEHGVKKLGGLGYCFGAKFLAHQFKKGDAIDVGYFAHPSFVTEEELTACNGPLSIAACETDSIFTVPLRHKSEEILRRSGRPWQINLFSGVTHGFAIRCDTRDKAQRFAKEQAFCQAVAWFNEWLL